MVLRLTALVFALLLAVLCGRPQISGTTEGPKFVPGLGCKMKVADLVPAAAVAASGDKKGVFADHSEDSCVYPIGYDPQCYFFDKTDNTTEGLSDTIKKNCFFPLFHSSFLLHPKLKQYPTDSHFVAYPPWTYHGFHPPSDWGNIPPFYFATRKKQSTGKFTGLAVAIEESGLSFIEPAPESTLTNFGISNCSDTYYPAPLDIITANAKENHIFVEFSFTNFDETNAFVMFFPEDGTDLLFVKLQNHPQQTENRPTISSGATTGSSLTFDRLLIHYGPDSNVGSEHKINGKSYGMELQFFFNLQDKKPETPYYRTLEDYLIQRDEKTYGKNLLVLCVLVEVANTTGKFPSPGKEFNRGLKILSQAAAAFHTTRNLGKYRAYASAMKVLRLSEFLDVPNKGLYYTYYGSLTHPPCFNNTRYAVFETPLYMRRADWRKFLFIPSAFSDSSFVAGNFRPMETMMVRSNVTKKLGRFDKQMQEKVSYTVRKSRISSQFDRLLEYDYYEDSNLTIQFRKKHSPKTNAAGSVEISKISISFLSVALFVLMSF